MREDDVHHVREVLVQVFHDFFRRLLLAGRRKAPDVGEQDRDICRFTGVNTMFALDSMIAVTICGAT